MLNVQAGPSADKLVGKVQIGAIHNKTCAQNERAARRSPSVCASLLPSEGKAKPTLPAKAGGCGTKRGRLAGSPNSVMTTNLRSAKAKPILSPCKGQPGRIRQKVRGYLGGNPLVYSFAKG
jgi:hypothetical protein